MPKNNLWRLNLELIQSQCAIRRRSHSYKKWDFYRKLIIRKSLITWVVYKIVLITRRITFFENDALRLHDCDWCYGIWKFYSTYNYKSFSTKIWTVSLKAYLRWNFFSFLCLGKGTSLATQRYARSKMFRFTYESVGAFSS